MAWRLDRRDSSYLTNPHPLRSIGAYLGLVPSEASSGQLRSQGAITKTGNTHARRLLVGRPGITAARCAGSAASSPPAAPDSLR